MICTIVLLMVLPALVTCSGEGNIRLLEDEIANALKSCKSKDNAQVTHERQRRYENSYDKSPKIDDNMKEVNRYSHERRNTSNDHVQVKVLNASSDNYNGFGSRKIEENLSTFVPNNTVTWSSNGNTTTVGRAKRSEALFHKPDSDQCLSQCVFANLQVVDSRGIPREAELWNKVQSSVTSQQSRSALQDQIRACFQELQSEAEDNGCSYSNKLERCLMLRFADRKIKQPGITQTQNPE